MCSPLLPLLSSKTPRDLWQHHEQYSRQMKAEAAAKAAQLAALDAANLPHDSFLQSKDLVEMQELQKKREKKHRKSKKPRTSLLPPNRASLNMPSRAMTPGRRSVMADGFDSGQSRGSTPGRPDNMGSLDTIAPSRGSTPNRRSRATSSDVSDNE